MKRALLTALMIGVTAVWGWTFGVVKDAILLYGVLAFLAIRFAIASAALAPLCWSTDSCARCLAGRVEVWRGGVGRA